MEPRVHGLTMEWAAAVAEAQAGVQQQGQQVNRALQILLMRRGAQPTAVQRARLAAEMEAAALRSLHFLFGP